MTHVNLSKTKKRTSLILGTTVLVLMLAQPSFGSHFSTLEELHKYYKGRIDKEEKLYEKDDTNLPPHTEAWRVKMKEKSEKFQQNTGILLNQWAKAVDLWTEKN